MALLAAFRVVLSSVRDSFRCSHRRYDAAAHDGMHAPDVIDPTVDFLPGLAGNGTTLEFGIGTGRIAIPLRARGISVDGVDLYRTWWRRCPTGRAASTFR